MIFIGYSVLSIPGLPETPHFLSSPNLDLRTLFLNCAGHHICNPPVTVEIFAQVTTYLWDFSPKVQMSLRELTLVSPEPGSENAGVVNGHHHTPSHQNRKEM